MTRKDALRDAESIIENALNELEIEHDFRTYSIRIISGRGEPFEVLITEDGKKGGCSR